MIGTVDDFFKAMDLTLRREMRSGFFLAYPLFQKLSERTGRFSFGIEYWDESRLLVVGNVRTWPQRGAIIYNYSYRYCPPHPRSFLHPPSYLPPSIP